MGRQRLFDAEKLKADFVTSTCTLRELASRNNASYSFVTKLASSEKWSEQRDKHREASVKLAVEVVPPATSPKQHIDRSLLTGDQIHQLLREAMAAIKVGDIRSLKTLVDAWSSWDNQMRKTHRIDEQSSNVPVVNIHLLSAL
jgi:hypothetical protein